MRSPRSAAAGSTLDDVDALLARRGLRLLRAWPRDVDHLLLELARDGARVAAQWFASTDRAARVAAQTRGAEQLDRIVLQPGGADRRLPGLGTLLGRKGAELVAHRPEKRAVVRLPASSRRAGRAEYAKVVRGAVLTEVVRTARSAAALPLRTPALTRVEAETGAVVTAALPGRTLHELLASPAGPAACRATGQALAQLHRAPTPPDLQRHDEADERAVVGRWQRLARAHGLAPAFPVPDEQDGEDGRPRWGASGAEERVLVHRDFHDRQVVVDEDGEVGLLDFDLMALGSPVLDLANVLVHLDLRARQGLLADPAPLRAAVLEGYRPTGAQLGRLARSEHITWQRLALVYAFRPPRSPT